jgi:hypothetical protein
MDNVAKEEHDMMNSIHAVYAAATLVAATGGLAQAEPVAMPAKLPLR